MGFETALNLVVNYGLGIVLAIGIAFMFWRLLLFVLKENSKREDRLAGIIEQHLKALEGGNNQLQQQIMAHDARASEFSKQILEALRYNREEHTEIVRVLKELKEEISDINKRS